MYKREITPLSESMLDAISSTINKLEYVEEVELDEAYKSTKPIEDYVEKGKWLNPRSIPKELTAKIGPVGSMEKIRQVMLIRGSRTSPVNAIALLTSMTPAEVAKLLDVDRSVVYKIRKKSIIYVDMKLDTILESVELEEAPNTLEKITAILTKMGNGTKVVKDKAGYFHIKMSDGKNMSHKGPYHTLEDVLSALQKDMKEEVELEEKYAKATDKLDDGKGMDPVGKADADIDNDGDVDSSDEYLHKRRKAIGKAMKKRKD